MNMSVENSDVNGDCCYRNSSTGSITSNPSSIYHTKKRDEIYTNKYLRVNYGLPDGVDIDNMLPVYASNQYVNIEYNNEHHNIHINGNN